MGDLDLSGVDPGAIEEVHRQGEVCLQGTLMLALAADQRATVMAGIFGAGAVALLAATATLLGVPESHRGFLYAALSAAVFLFFGMTLCAWAALPVKFFVAGYEPRKLAASASSRLWILRYASEDLQRRIDKNREALNTASNRFTWGLLLGLASPLVAALGYAYPYLL